MYIHIYIYIEREREMAGRAAAVERQLQAARERNVMILEFVAKGRVNIAH